MGQRLFFCGIPTSGPPATAVRFGNRPVLPVGRHLTGQKGFETALLRSVILDVARPVICERLPVIPEKNTILCTL